MEEAIDVALNTTNLAEQPRVGLAQLKCLLARQEWEAGRGGAELLSQSCPPHWDSILCWPPVRAGRVARLPCPALLRGVLYDTRQVATLACLPANPPVWQNKELHSNIDTLI